MNLHEIFHLPPTNGVRLIRVGSASGPQLASNERSVSVTDATELSTQPTPEGLLDLVDDVNIASMEALRAMQHPAAFLCTFVRGSVVQSRLHVAGFRWQQLVRQFELKGVFRELEGRFGGECVRRVVSRLRKRVLAKVLRHEDQLGPAKLVIRLRMPDETFMAKVDLKEAIAFAEDFAKRAGHSDETMRELFVETRLGGAAQAVRRKWEAWVTRFFAEAPAGTFDGVFEQQVRILEEERCLHPCLAISAGAIERSARLLEVEPVCAREAINILRFAWLTLLETPEDLSDLSVKCVVVFPKETRDREELVAETAGLLERTTEVFHDAVARHPRLGAFHDQYPAVRVGDMTECVAMSKPLFEVLSASGSPLPFLRFLSSYRMGGAYLRGFVKSASHEAGLQLPREVLRDASQSIVQLLRKRPSFGEGDLVTKTVVSQKWSPQKVLRMFTKVIESGQLRELERFAGRLGRIGRADYEGNQRGLWTLAGRKESSPL